MSRNRVLRVRQQVLFPGNCVMTPAEQDRIQPRSSAGHSPGLSFTAVRSRRTSPIMAGPTRQISAVPTLAPLRTMTTGRWPENHPGTSSRAVLCFLPRDQSGSSLPGERGNRQVAAQEYLLYCHSMCC
jgi:hypothetical protein